MGGKSMATEYQPIYQNRDFYVPAYDLQIEGLKQGAVVAKDILEVRCADGLGQIDTFEITVNNWDAKNLDFKYTGAAGSGPDEYKGVYMPGKVVELRMGYLRPGRAASDSLQLMLAGTIKTVAPNFPASGQPTLKVSGQSVLAKLLTEQETHYYGPNVTVSKIARTVVGRGTLKLNNLTVGIKTDANAEGQETALDHLLQDNQYDIVFLLQLAQLQGYDLVLKDMKTKPYLFFGPSESNRFIAYRLEWGKSLISFQPTLSTAKQVKEVVVRGWNALEKEKIEAKVTQDQLEIQPLRNQETLSDIKKDFQNCKEIIVDRPFRNDQEAKSFAKGQLLRLTRNTVTARGATLGTPDLRAGSKVEIIGLGPIFQGTYLIGSTSHHLGPGGYVTEFEAHLEERKS